MGAETRLTHYLTLSAEILYAQYRMALTQLCKLLMLGSMRVIKYCRAQPWT
jgi:hypothetical protein